jgi:hypothetical protein
VAGVVRSSSASTIGRTYPVTVSRPAKIQGKLVSKAQIRVFFQ